MDIIFIGIIAALFGLSWLFLKLIDRIEKGRGG
jgi:hypothetical protein